MLVSVNTDDLAAVIELARLTEARTNSEQKSMLAVAERLDGVLNRHSNFNPRWRAFEYDGAEWTEAQFEAEVDQTRGELEGGDRHVNTSWERDPEKYAKRQQARDAEVAAVLAKRAEVLA